MNRIMEFKKQLIAIKVSMINQFNKANKLKQKIKKERKKNWKKKMMMKKKTRRRRSRKKKMKKETKIRMIVMIRMNSIKLNR